MYQCVPLCCMRASILRQAGLLLSLPAAFTTASLLAGMRVAGLTEVTQL